MVIRNLIIEASLLFLLTASAAQAECARPVLTTDEKNANDLCRKHSSGMGYEPEYKTACLSLTATLKTKYYDAYTPCIEAEKQAAEAQRKAAAQGDVDAIQKAAGQ